MEIMEPELQCDQCKNRYPFPSQVRVKIFGPSWIMLLCRNCEHENAERLLANLFARDKDGQYLN